MAMSFLLLLSTAKIGAIPIRPDIRKMLSEPEPSTQFAPARAGWNGPETPVRVGPAENTFEQIGPTGTMKLVHQAVFATFVPDYRAVGAIILIILLLRRITTRRRPVLATASATGISSISMDRPAVADIPSKKVA